MVAPFDVFPGPILRFGPGRVREIPHLLPSSAVLVLTGAHFTETESWTGLEQGLKDHNIRYSRETVHGEPSPETVDALVEEHRGGDIRTVLAIGGGSVLDTGKAVSAMLEQQGSVIEYLEGVGIRTPLGRSKTMIAVPTTGGTGSEATKNAVISRRGPGGFKKSLRHDAFIPKVAVLDPVLALDCPIEVSLPCGLDAYCQLLESWVSTRANPVTDALAWTGLRLFLRSWDPLRKGKGHDVSVRGDLALAAFLSGQTLANAGLGTVHGLAGPLGSLIDIPHGVVCGLLLAPVFRRSVAVLRETNPESPALEKLSRLGALALRGENAEAASDDVDRLLDLMDTWSGGLPRLKDYGFNIRDLDRVVEASGNKDNPAVLSSQVLKGILQDIMT